MTISERTGRGPEQTVSDMYLTDRYSSKNPGWHSKDAPWKAAQILSLVQDEGLTFNTICDIGCGSGAVLKNLRGSLKPEVGLTGFEPAPDAFAMSKTTSAGIEIHNRPVRPGDGPYDLALVLDVFEHVEDHFGFLRSISAVASQFIFHIPLDLSVSSLIRVTPLTEGRKNAGHLHYFCRETALATLVECGYTIRHERFTPVALSAPTTRARTKVLCLPRQLGRAVSPNLTARWLGGFSLLVLATPAQR